MKDGTIINRAIHMELSEIDAAITMGVDDEVDSHLPLFGPNSSSCSSSSSSTSKLPFQKSGTIWTAVAHIIAAVIGSGVLSIAWATAQLGWIAGPITIICFAVVMYIAACLLSDCYRTDDHVTGKPNPSYNDAVRVYLGRQEMDVVVWFASVCELLWDWYCLRNYKCNKYEIATSQIPDFHNMAWLSVVAALMSFCYSFIGLGLGFSKVIDNKSIKGSIVGIPTKSASQKIWLVFQALGNVAFAYPYVVVLLEIQDTLKSPPPENQTMKKASMTAIVTTTFFYLCLSCFGYAAFGNDTPGNLLTGFDEPFWLVDFANACIVLHLVGGYQVFSQPVFAFVESWATQKYPENIFVNKFYTIKLPVLPALQLNFFRLCFRTLYVISTTVTAMTFPYFNQVLGVLGALIFWPTTVYFPVEMYIVQKKIGAWTKKWLLLEGFSMICLIVSVLAFIGSIVGILSAKFS
ncbi:putative amino acid permease 7 [Capsicum annuum]|nr:putative amino acid permease 7 [Capsicum annuum]